MCAHASRGTWQSISCFSAVSLMRIKSERIICDLYFRKILLPMILEIANWAPVRFFEDHKDIQHGSQGCVTCSCPRPRRISQLGFCGSYWISDQMLLLPLELENRLLAPGYTVHSCRTRLSLRIGAWVQSPGNLHTSKIRAECRDLLSFEIPEWVELAIMFSQKI
jgi:hypothetical protein